MTQEYIIDEELVELIEEALKSEPECKPCPYEADGFKSGVASFLRSNPYNPQADRERVLDKLDKRCKVCARGWCETDTNRDPFNEVREWIKELRQGGEP